MTQPEQPISKASSGNNVTVTRWNNAVASTRFPEYIFNASTYTYGGNLNAYRRTWAGYSLGSIDAYGSRYTEFRDIRSTFMTKTVTSGQPATNTWQNVTGYGLSNSYNSTNQEGRLTLDSTNGTITPNVNSAYVFWAGITISSIPSNTTAAFLQIQTSGVTIADVNQNLDLISGQSLVLRNQTFVAYKNTAHIIRIKLLYTGNAPDYVITFGYTELIGQKSGCGEYSIL